MSPTFDPNEDEFAEEEALSMKDRSKFLDEKASHDEKIKIQDHDRRVIVNNFRGGGGA